MLWMLSRKRRRERCQETRALMSDYLEGELERPQAAAVESHLRWCRQCRRVLANLRRTMEGLGRLNDARAPFGRPPA
jgi:anti-sigma factor RsiW